MPEYAISPDIIIGVPCGETPRLASLWTDIMAFQVPEGLKVIVQRTGSKSPARNRNDIIRHAKACGAKKILFLDDDMGLPPQLLRVLHQHDKDIVGAVYAMSHARDGVIWPCVFDHQGEDGQGRLMALGPQHQGLCRVAAMGAGAMMVKVEIFDRPELADKDGNWFTLGQLNSEEWGDDLDFFRRAGKCGIESYCDFDLTADHLFRCMLHPERDPDGKWQIAMKFAGDEVVKR